MPASRAVTGNRAVFYIGSVASPFSYNALLEVKSISPNFITVPEVNISHLLSPNATEEFFPGMNKPGKMEVMGNFIGDSTQLSILSLAQQQIIIFWKFTCPVDQVGGVTSKVYTANGIGYIAEYSSGPVEQNKAFEYKLGIQITGSPTEAVA